MSWYNDLNSGKFIDATQEIIGGDTIVTATTEVQNTEDLVITETTPDAEEETTIGNVLLPAVFNEEEGTYDLYIRNVNQGGRIFLTTRGTSEKVKIENGLLYVYYDYDFLNAPTIPGGWTDIVNYAVATRQIVLGEAATIAGISGTLYTPVIGLAIRFPIVESSAASSAAAIVIHDTRIEALEVALFNQRVDPNIEDVRNNFEQSMLQFRQEYGERAENFINMIEDAFTAGGNSRNLLYGVIRSRGDVLVAFLTGVLGGVLTIGTYATIIFGIYDRLKNTNLDKAEAQLLTTYEKIKQESDATIVNLIHKDGLSIQSSTNGGFTTPGVYEVDILYNNRLEIEINSNNIASIKKVINTGIGYNVGDVISIAKTDLGGGTGNLLIDVNTLYSEEELILLLLNDIESERIGLQNRQRRRRNIPNTSSFSSDGFTITNIAITEPITNEVTNEPTISLKVDTSQFQYDGSGNLQIKSSVLAPSISTDPSQFTTDPNTGNLQIIDYDKIAEIGDDTVGAETGLYQYVLDKIDQALGDQETYDANGNVVVPATNIYQNINNVYELIMVGDQTFQNNNDYKLNLGYKTIWTGYAYDLITIALKAVRSGIFDSSFYNNDYLGYFPSLTRISDDEYMTPVKDVNVEILTNLTFKKGLVYFEQNDPLIDYDLNRKFEFVCFVRPIDTDNTNVEYTLLQTGIEIGPGQYDLDNYKLKLGFRNNHFEITHNVRRVVDYYETLTTKNYYNPGAVTDILVEDATTGTTSISKYVPTNLNLQMLWGIFSQQTYQNVLPWANLHTLLQRDDTYTHFSNSVFQLYDWNFNTLRDMTSPATTTWGSPKIIFHEYQDINLPRRGIGKIKIKYEYRYAQTTGNIMGTKTFTSQSDIDNNLEFRLRVNIKKYNDPTNTIYGSRIYDFTEWQYDPVSLNPPAGYVSFYTKTLWMPHITYPLLSTDEYNYYELELVHRGGSFTPLPTGSQSYNFYANQHSIRIYSINYFEYDTTPTTFADHSIQTFQDTADFFPTPIDTNHWYKVVAELDLPNKVVQYWVDGVNNYFTFDTINNIPHSSLQLPQSDPTVPYFYSADWEYANNTYTSLVRDNDIIVIGNEPSAGELNFTHFAWKHFQDPLDNYMTQEERDKLDTLINYNYYYETVKVDRYLKVKEFYADVLDARKILINGGFAYGELSPGDQITLLRSEDQSGDNVAITNAFVNIDKLFVSDPVASGNGFLSYNATTKEFTIGSSTISAADVEIAVGSLVKISPSTYGLVFNQTDPLDKYLQIDDVYINNLINLVIQNELILTNAFTDNTYGDVLIQIKDASSYSPYDLRELEDTNVRYNYKINGNHQYLYRELNQEIQYDPLLGTAFGDLYPVVMYHFQGEIINNARDWLTGIPASDYDFEMLVQGGQVVYGSGPLNMKNFNGVEGGNTEIRTKNVMAISSAFRTCISFFHKPFGSNIDGTDDHVLVKFIDTNNYPVFYIKLEYVSNNAVYKLIFVNPGNIADETSFTFNNSENEIYFGNENCILLWCDQPYWHFYINGKYHGVSINQTYNYGASGIRDCKILIDLNYYNNRSLLYELKVYPKLLFKTASGGNLSSNDLTFNNKVVVDVTEMIRIITFNSGGFIIKELSGVQETKARSIETKVRSLDTQRRVSTVEVKLPATGTGTKGFVYSDGVNENYNLENPLDLTAVSTTALSLDDRKILTFKEIPNGSDFDIKILSRSITSISQRDKLIDYSYLGITPLTIYDDPHPPYEYTFLLSFIETQMQSQGFFYQFETDNVGVPTTGSLGISFLMQVLGGDVIKYSGANGVWGIYREQNSVYTLIQTLNDGDEFLADNYKYRLDALYFRKNNDPNTQIRIFIYGPYLFADKIDLGEEYNMFSALSTQHTEPLKNWHFISASSRKKYNHIMTDGTGTIRPLFVPAGEKVITTNGMPSDEDTYFKWSWGINYTQIACLMESGDLLLNGDVYVNCPTNAPFDMNNGILVNRIDNLVSPDRASITGIPALVEQVYYIELTSWDRTNFIAYFSGTDRINTYTNQVVSQFEFYYDDTIEISVSASVLSDIQTYPYHGVGIATPSYSIGFNANNIVTHKFLKSFGSGPYVDVSFGFDYIAQQLNRITIPINLQDIVDYHNEAFLTTDEYILKYKPHTNTFIWEENIGMALDTGQEETAIPLGSFKAKTSTKQISSRRTLASAVPIEKISQKTKYQVFNTEVEINGNLLLEEVNKDVASLFTIYTNEDKQDPVSGLDNFKDKASITLKDATKEWVFKREPESEDIAIATTKFIHDTTTLLTLRHNQVDCGVELKVGTIRFADNSTLTTQPIAYTDTDVRSVLSSSAGTGLTWNSGTNQFDNNITQYTDTNVRTVLSSSAGTGITWNSGTNQFDNNITQYTDTNVRSVLSSSAGTGLVWNATNNQLDNSITQYTDTDVRNVLSSSAGTGLVWNSGTNKFDNSITQYTDTDVRNVLSSSAGTGLVWNSGTNQFDNTITQYTDADVRNVLSSSAGTGLVWNATTNQFDNSITQYTDTLARTAVYPITQTNSGLPVVNGGMELFDTGVWYNSTDGRNRFNFNTDGSTYIRTPLIDGNHILLQHGSQDRFYTGHTRNTSAVDLEIGTGATNPAQLFLRGTNSQTLSSAVIFGDAGTSTTAGNYYQGMIIYYDSSANRLHISGDTDFNSVIDTPPAISVNRTNRYVGILKQAPVFPLDVDGNANISGQVSTSQIFFTGDSSTLTSGNIDYNNLVNKPTLANVATSGDYNDLTNQPTIPTIPSYLFAPSYFKVIFDTATRNLHGGFTPAQNSFFGTQVLNVGGYSHTASDITIPANGVYEIAYTMLVRSQNDGSDRKINPTYIRVNNTDPHGIKNAIGSCYLRYRTTTNNRENCQGASTILELNQNDLISMWSYREGSGGTVYITGNNGHLTIKRIA